jgi:DNA-directed RNA polymerase alpha subunit
MDKTPNAAALQGDIQNFGKEGGADERKDKSETQNRENQDRDGDKAELEACREKIRQLSSVIDDIKRQDREKKIFGELYPKVAVDEIPDTVLKEAKEEGIPLAAAYALYARRLELENEKAAEKLINSGVRTSGAVGRQPSEQLFSIDQIRAMSAKEVKRQYRAVMKSLAKGKA